MKKSWGLLRSHKAGNILIVFAVVQIACFIAAVLFPHDFAYLGTQNIQTLLKSIPPLAILATGVGMLMIAGEFDLSVGSNFALTAFVLAVTFNMGLPAPLAGLLAVALGCFIGLVNGLITLKARIPSFIATLGAMMFWRGILQIMSGGQTAPFRPDQFLEKLLSGSFGPMQAQFLWAIAVALLAHLILERHKLGNHIFAVGGNRESAVAIGVYPNTVKMICFVIVGALAAFAGIISSARVHSVSPDQGKGLELQAISACVIGGVSLMGGEGSIIGIFLGSALLFTIQDVLLLLRAPGFYLDMFMGIMIVVAVVSNRLTKKERD